MKTYRDLIVWQKSVHFVTALYQGTKGFPREEIYEVLYEGSREIERMLSSLISKLNQ